MSWKLFNLKLRRIAIPMLALAVATAFGTRAETSGSRFSAPALGWLLSPDGTQAIEITGVTASPRPGAAVGLPATASRLWPSPDGRFAVVEAGSALYWVRSGFEPALLTAAEPEFSVSLAWDRGADGFAACWNRHCETRSATGGFLETWEIGAGRTLLAYSAGNGTVTASPDGAEWRAGGMVFDLGAAPVAAAFRPGTNELWILDAEGKLTGRTPNGGVTGSGALLAGSLGLAVSSDGQRFFAADAAGSAAVTDLRTGTTSTFQLETGPAGLWAAPGSFAVRLHDSLKKPVAFWDGETGTTGFAPAGDVGSNAAAGEVIQ